MKPNALTLGDTIGIVSLGSPVDPEIAKKGIHRLEQMGYNVVLGKHVFSKTFPVSSAKDRACDLMLMFKNKKVKLILASRGGTGVSDILPYLDFKYIRYNPKIISGYSDISILLNTIYRTTKLITFNGLMLVDIADSPLFNLEQFFSMLSIPIAPRPILNPPSMPFIGKVKGNVTGKIVGGNLTSIVGSLGTPFEICTKGRILFLEEIGEPTTKIYRMLNQLKLAGKFKDCIGIIMGECTECQTVYNTTYENLIEQILVPLGKPLLTNVATGHGLYKVTIPIGSCINLNTFNNTLTILKPVVQSGN